MTRILGALLAGGQSRRFGSDKALAMLDGQTLIDRVFGQLRMQVNAVVICGREGPYGISDRPGSGLGPLGGLNAALHHARDLGFDAVASVPCDTPFLPADLVHRLRKAGLPSFVVTMPVIGLWPSRLADELERHLATSNDRSMRRWTEIISATLADLGEMTNVNTVTDLKSLLRVL